MNKKRAHKLITMTSIYLFAFFIINLFFLTKYPSMHSDESWLSGLSRTMMNEGLNSTESFFDLYKRYPHAIKSIFHIIQIGFIKIFGYNLFSVRLISLIFSVISLKLFHGIIEEITKKKTFAFISMVFLSLEIQFIYASHFARAEIIILTIMLLCVYYILKNVDNWKIKNDIICGVIIGLSIGIHPNAFLVAMAVGGVYLYFIIIKKKLKIKNLGILIGIVGLFSIIFILISFSFDSNFINNYLAYGETLGATSNTSTKIQGIIGFYERLVKQINVTYYLPNIYTQIVLGVVVIIGSIISYLENKKSQLLFIFPLIFINIGYILIGRYSQPSILFIIVFIYLLGAIFINSLNRPLKIIALIFIIIISLFSIYNIAINTNNDYEEYINEIQLAIPEDSQVLGNLNTEYAFSYDNLLDYRNLGFLEENQIEFSDYIINNEIEYIIYPEEIEYIYNNRPVWNILYGNVYPYYDDMDEFLNDNCELVSEFNSPYGMRILKYSNDKEWYVKIYRVND